MTRTLADMLDLHDDDEPTEKATPDLAPLRAGDQVHALGSITISTTTTGSYGGGQLDYGQTITLTDALLEASRDRLGNSIFDLVDDEAAQESRFEKVLLRRGPFPAHLPPHPGGSAEELWARQAAREAAAGIADPEQRAAAQKANRERYGVESSQRGSKVYGGAL